MPELWKKRFVRYVNNENNQSLSDKVGRCDREQSCGYHYSPKHYFNDIKQDYTPLIPNTTLQNTHQQIISFHENKELELSLNNYDKNNLVKFLKSKFDIIKVDKMIKQYNIGTQPNKFYGTIFWQVDSQNKIRGGKIISYDNLGKRTKYINWVHADNIKQSKIKGYNLKQCLFGEHLLSNSTKPIAIVESEKTACIMSMLFSKYEWMATGSLNGLNEKKIKVIKHRTIILYPDLGIDNGKGTPFLQWQQKRDALHKLGFDIEISDLLEQKSTCSDREKGLDIADYFIENSNRKPIKIKTKAHKIFLDMYLKNKNLKTLIDVFDLNNFNGNDISF